MIELLIKAPAPLVRAKVAIFRSTYLALEVQQMLEQQKQTVTHLKK